MIRALLNFLYGTPMPGPVNPNLKPSPQDPRDYKLLSILPPEAAYPSKPLPSELDLRPQLQPVRNQGEEGTCVGHALASGVLGFWQTKTGFNRILSVRDSYASGRAMALVNASEGVYIRDALHAAYRHGTCEETYWPYKPYGPGEPKPNYELSKLENRLKGYANVGTSESVVKRALVENGALITCLMVTEGFDSPDKGFRASRRGYERGYHAVAIVGYSDDKQAWLIRNSWGTWWGDKGYCWLPYTYGLIEAWSVSPEFSGTPLPPRKAWPWFLGFLNYFC